MGVSGGASEAPERRVTVNCMIGRRARSAAGRPEGRSFLRDEYGKEALRILYLRKRDSISYRDGGGRAAARRGPRARSGVVFGPRARLRYPDAEGVTSHRTLQNSKRTPDLIFGKSGGLAVCAIKF